MKHSAKSVGMLSGLLLIVAVVHAGGVDPREIPPAEPVMREKVTVTPQETSTAVTRARQAVAPVVEEVPVVKQVPVRAVSPQAVTAADKNSWLLGSREGACAPLESVSRTVKNIGSFKTPQEFAHQMQQRGYQAYLLDIGDTRDQVVRVKVPDQDLDLTFVRAGLCR